MTRKLIKSNLKKSNKKTVKKSIKRKIKKTKLKGGYLDPLINTKNMNPSDIIHNVECLNGKFECKACKICGNISNSYNKTKIIHNANICKYSPYYKPKPLNTGYINVSPENN